MNLINIMFFTGGGDSVAPFIDSFYLNRILLQDFSLPTCILPQVSSTCGDLSGHCSSYALLFTSLAHIYNA